MYQCELYKIRSKNIVKVCLLLLLGWFAFYFYASNVDADSSACRVDGVIYKGMEAVAKNKEIAKEYEGILTMEKAQAIIDRFGFATVVMDENEYYRDGNYVSQFITDTMTSYRVNSFQTPDEITFFSGDEDANARYIKELLAAKPYFAYMEGWQDLYETAFMIIILLNFIITIAIANVFTEEYSLRTAPVLLTTQNGRKKDIWAKIGAAFTFSAVVYLIFCSIMILTYVIYYGIDGLKASACLSNWASYSWTGLFGNTMGAILAELFLWGFCSVILNTCITLCISAVCKQPFISILVGLAVLVFPFLYNKVLSGLLPPVFLVRLVQVVAGWLPAYLPTSGTMTTLRLPMVLFILGVSIVTLLIGNYKYRNYQDVG